VRIILSPLLFIASSVWAASTLTPRTQWVFVPGAQDLVQVGLWSCVSGVTMTGDTLTVAATAAYNTISNTVGPVLHPDGDFSVLADLSAPLSSGTFLTLVGTLATGSQFWQGLKRLDVGVLNKNIVANYWTGNSANPTSHTFPLPQGASDAIVFEVARIGAQITVFANGSEAGSFPDPGIFASGVVYLGFNVAPNNTLTVLALAAAMPSGGDTTLYAAYLQVAKRTGSALRDIAEPEGFLVGGAVNPDDFSDPGYVQAVGREFNLMVPENVMKFAETEPGPHQFDFCPADQIMAYARANNMKVRGHNLVWQQDLPSWLTNGNYSSSDASAILQEHINTVMGHFKGQLVDWDVVNEAIAYSPPYGPQPSYWLTQLGSNYIDMAFQWAHQADPNVKLFYNDTGGEGLGAKSDAVYNLVKGLLSRGVPIDGVGLQMHEDLTSAPSQSDISSNMARLAALGLQVHVTEMDVRVPVDANGNASAADLASQAAIYQSVMTACQSAPNCTAFLTWGFSDKYSWIPSTFPGFGAGLLLDANFQPKPAYSSVANVMRSNSHTQVPTIASVTNGASFTAGSITPGEIATLFGGNLTSATGVNLTSGLPLPTNFLNTSISVNGSLVPLFAIDNVNNQQQINFQVPWEVSAQPTAQIEVQHNGIPSQSLTVPVVSAQPGIINYSSGGNNFGVILHAANYQLADSSHPAVPGETILIYCTGLGAVHSPPEDGSAASGQTTVVNATVTIGGVSSTVSFNGLAPEFVGLNQVNVIVPQGLPAANQPVVLTINSVASPTVLLPVQ
jgi:endo-1,4-beta-xylanase